jgi:hypothetical protein
MLYERQMVVFGGTAAQVTPAEAHRTAKLKHLSARPDFSGQPTRQRVDSPSIGQT